MTVDPASLFKLCNLIAMLGWTVLTANLLTRRSSVWWPVAAIPIALSVLYTGLVFWLAPGSKIDFGSLAGVASAFSNPWWLLAGWTHYLAFDLLVGTWQVQQAYALKMPRLSVLICLLLTFMFGPAGWLVFLLLRAWNGRKVSRSLPEMAKSIA
ncbi:MAG: DUF4281 domain-containing protein [Herminiimonas sp.]|nr:DUF4281 domain-containing protein [Herminiimonas sp.]